MFLFLDNEGNVLSKETSCGYLDEGEKYELQDYYCIMMASNL
jgi:hypothetical protein